MSAPLLYLLKANAGLLLGALAYFGLLRQLTFFPLNRAYLLLVLVFAFGYPALPVPALPALAATQALPLAVAGWLPALGTASSAAAGPVVPAGFDWAGLVLLAYGLGTASVLARLLAQLVAVARLHRAATPAVLSGQPYRRLTSDAGPFSFGPTIYLNPDRHPAHELAAVLRHEQAHVRQWHTADVLLAQLALALAWCNPAAWLLRRAVLDNLEYLADRAALRSEPDRRAYQYSLLRLSTGGAGPAVVSPFTFLTLKNRIAMMNAPASATARLGYYLLAVPLLLGLGLGFQAVPTQAAAPAALTAQARVPVYYIDGKLSGPDRAGKLKPGDIASVQVLKPELARQLWGSDAPDGAVVVTTKSNVAAPDVQAFNARVARAAPPQPGTETPAEVNVLTPAALAYITKHHPNSRIIGVTKLTYPSTGNITYKVQLAEGMRPHYVFFDEQGRAVSN